MPWSSTPLYGLIGAELLIGFKSGSWVPSAAGFAQAWTPVPIYAYGVMLGTSLVVGWFIAMTLAKQDGIDQQEAGTIYMWTAVWSIVGSRLLYVITNIDEFDSVTQVLMVEPRRPGRLRRHDRRFPGQLVWLPQARHSAAAVGGRGGAVGRARHRDHARRLLAVRLRLRRAVEPALGDPLPAGRAAGAATAAPPGSTTQLRRARRQWSFPVHPTQIYESLVGLFLFALLMLIRKYRTFSGQVFLGWVLGYGILRPLIEIVRDDDQRGNVGSLSTSQFIGIVSVVLGIGLFVALAAQVPARSGQRLRLWQHVARGRPRRRSKRAAASAASAADARSGSAPRSRRRPSFVCAARANAQADARARGRALGVSAGRRRAGATGRGRAAARARPPRTSRRR